MFERASLKLGLDRAVMNGVMAGKGGAKAMTREEQEQLLKCGAYFSLQDTNGDAAQFLAADIDEILKSSSTKISYGEADEASGSVFSKAAFIADENAVDMDDPEFWTKILPEVRGRRPNPPNRARDPGC